VPPQPPRVPLLRKQLLAQIDPATTMICLDCAGQIRELADPFHTLVGDFDHPPFHRWCRSVIIPYLDGFLTGHRDEANLEIMRRPLAERRKGPAGVGARMIPGPHEATYERRGYVARGDYTDELDSILGLPDQKYLDALNRYLDDPVELDRQLRTGTLDPDLAAHVADLDEAITADRTRRESTMFGAIRTDQNLRVGDIVSDDTYLLATLDPAVAARHGQPFVFMVPAGHPATTLDRQTQRILLHRRHSWRLVALGVILVVLLL
jgi:hypothetical protein